MSGDGRHAKLLNELEPKDITMVDYNANAIVTINKSYQFVKTVCDDLISFIRKKKQKYSLLIGVWNNSYLSKQDIMKFLNWCHQQAKYILFVEPIHLRDQGIEWLIDKD